MSVASIRAAVPGDQVGILALCNELWPGAEADELTPHVAAILDGKPRSTLPLVMFVAEISAALVGFIEVGLRSHAEGFSK